MKKKCVLLIFIVGWLGLLFIPGCKTAEDAQYTLTVTVGEGVTGTPAAGSFSYTENETVSFSYAAQSGYGNLDVILDGVSTGNSGNIAMNMSHTLAATASIDVRGEWAGTLTYEGERHTLRLVFSGGLNSGTVSGQLEQVGPGSGTFSVTNGAIEILVNYGGGRITYTGTINNVDNMTGTYLSNYDEAGPWELDRQ